METGLSIFISLFSGVLGGVTGPIVERAQRTFRLRRQLKRPTAGVICPRGQVQDCPGFDQYISASRSLLADEPWLASHFESDEVILEPIVAVLVRYHMWIEREAEWYRHKKIWLFGPCKPHHRLALLLWAIWAKVLHTDCCAQTSTSGAGRGSGSQQPTQSSGVSTTPPVPAVPTDTFGRSVARTQPALVDHTNTLHNCDDIETFVGPSGVILEREQWVAPALQSQQVSLRILTPILQHYGYWQPCDRQAFQEGHVQVLGETECKRRLAVLLWTIHEGILRDRPDSASEDSFVTCLSHPVVDSDDGEDGAIDMRPSVEHHSFGRRTDWRGARSAFGECEPCEGLPVVISTMVVNLVMEIQCEPSLRVCLDGRRIRDLGRLMFDPRGSFDIQVVFAWRMYTPLGEVRSLDELPPPVRDCFQLYDLLKLCADADDLVFHRICNGSDGRYRRPVRPAEWDDSGVAPTGLRGTQRPFNWGTKSEWVHRRVDTRPMRMLMNRNQPLSPKCREFYKAWRFLGVPIEPADLAFGIFWVVTDSACKVYLGHFGEVTQTDLDQYYQKLVESGNARKDVEFYGWYATKELSHDPQRRYWVRNRKTKEVALRAFAFYIPWDGTPVDVS